MTGASRIGEWLGEVARVIQAIDPGAVARTAQALAEVGARGATIFIAGNGGSASTASHLALDLQKAGRAPGGRGTRAVALTDSVPLLTAWANDADYDRVFSEQLEVLAAPGDALVVISVSGSSRNLIAALDTARALGMVTVGLLGENGGKAAEMVDHAVIVRSGDYGWVESAHVVLHHILTYTLRDAAREHEVTAHQRGAPT